MSLPVGLLLGALTVDLPKQNRSFGILPNLLFSDLMVIIGVGLALLLILAGGIYAWTKFRRRRRRHVSGGQKVYRGASDEGDDEEHEDDDLDRASEPAHSNSRRRYKYRVRRRTHRSRNPTLSETGGLPPAKSPEPTKL